MNDKDKEAFVKFMGEGLPCSYYDSYHCREKEAWQAACEHKQKEIDELNFKRLKLSLENSKYFHLLSDSVVLIDKIQAKNTNLIKKFNYALSIMKDNHWDAEESEIEYQVYKILENALNEKL